PMPEPAPVTRATLPSITAGTPTSFAKLLMVRDHAELLHQAEHVGRFPAFDDPPIGNTPHADRLDRNLLSGRWDAHQCTLVCAPDADAHRYPVSFSDGVLDGDAEVWE